jgi:hypothetical protein
VFEKITRAPPKSMKAGLELRLQIANLQSLRKMMSMRERALLELALHSLSHFLNRLVPARPRRRPWPGKLKGIGMLKLLRLGNHFSSVPSSPVPCVRPSLLDLRFTGDAWVVDHQDGTASIRLEDYQLASLCALPFDCPFLNQLLLQLRLGRSRRRAAMPCGRTYH